MIDISRRHTTRDGRPVIGLEYVPYNSALRKVTYPIKGTIVNEGKKRNEYCIWSEDGKADVVWGNHSEQDLMLELGGGK